MSTTLPVLPPGTGETKIGKDEVALEVEIGAARDERNRQVAIFSACNEVSREAEIQRPRDADNQHFGVFRFRVRSVEVERADLGIRRSSG
jgi:hypothetical protein